MSIVRKLRLIKLANNSLVQWFSADLGVTVSNGLVSGGDDSGALQNHAQQPATNVQHLDMPDGIGGKPMIYFGKTGSAESRTMSDLNSTVCFPSANFTLFSVHKMQAATFISYLSGGVYNGLFISSD